MQTTEALSEAEIDTIASRAWRDVHGFDAAAMRPTVLEFARRVLVYRDEAVALKTDQQQAEQILDNRTVVGE